MSIKQEQLLILLSQRVTALEAAVQQLKESPVVPEEVPPPKKPVGRPKNAK